MANANNFLRLGEAAQSVVQYEGMPPVRITINTYLVGETFVIERWIVSVSGTQRTEKRFDTQEAFEAFLATIARQYPWTQGKLL